MAYPNNPYPASYKVYNGTSWVEYYFRTSADLVGETAPYNGDESYARKFVTNKVYVNGVPFGFSSLPTSGAVAEVTVNASDINWYGGTKPTTNYLGNAANIQAALVALDTATHNAAQTASGYVPYTGATSDVDLGTHTIACGSLGFYMTVGGTKQNIGGFGLGSGGAIYIETNSELSNHAIVLEDTNSYIGSISNDNLIATHKWVEDKGYALATNLGTAAAKNFTTSVSQNSSDLVTSGAVYSAIASLPTPMQFKGTVGTGGTIEWNALPTAASTNNGQAYKVITAHDTAPICKVGDMIISNGSSWVVIPSGDEPSGTVTSVGLRNGSTSQGTITVSGSPITSSGTIDITLAANYGDTVNPYASKTKNYVLAAPSNANGTPSFRALVSADIPDLKSTYLPRDVGTTKQYPLFGTLNLAFIGSGNPQFYLDIGYNDDTGHGTIGSTWGTGEIDLMPYNASAQVPSSVNLYGTLRMMSDNGEEAASIHFNGDTSITFTLPNKSSNDTFAMISDIPITTVNANQPSSAKAGDIWIQLL